MGKTPELKTCCCCRKLRYIEDYPLVNTKLSNTCTYCKEKSIKEVTVHKGEKGGSYFYVIYNKTNNKLYKKSTKLLYSTLREAKKSVGSKFYKLKIVKIKLDIEDLIIKALEEAL